ncbi:MAG: hypothetical protein FJ315_03270, partial [SAR202 cluster bacterium]|nr:hypothetical protein [SAR202 cluster bacterium]
GQALPYLDGVTYIWITDQGLAFSAFRTGRLSCACGYTSDIFVNQKEQAEQAVRGIKFGTAWSANFLQLNTGRAPLNNLKARQALHIGFDRVQLREVLRGGTAFYPPTFFVPLELGGRLSLPGGEFLATPGFREPKALDTQESRRLFQEAGVDPARLTLKFVSSAVQKDITEAMASIIIGMGIKVDIQLVSNQADLIAQLTRGDFDVTYPGGGVSFDDPADLIASTVGTGGTLNYGKISNPTVDRLLADQDAELDFPKRRELLYQFQRELLKDAAFTPAHIFPALFATHSYVEGFVLKRAFSVGAHHRLDRVWFTQ